MDSTQSTSAKSTSNVKDSVKDQAKHVADDAKKVAQDAASEVKAQASSFASDMKDRAKEAIHQAQEQMKEGVNQGKEEVAGRVDQVAQAFHKTGDSLREEQQGNLAHYSDVIGDQVDRVSRYLSQHDTGDLLREVESFARKQPVLFVASAAALGVVAARFLKSSRHHDSSEALVSKAASSNPR